MNDTLIAIVAILLGVLLFIRISKRISEDEQARKVMTNQYDWITYGLRRDWIRGYCSTHDGYMTTEEERLFEEYDDPCIFIYRFMGEER